MIRRLTEISEDDFGLVGGKAYNLGKMIREGIPVPDGFVVTADAYAAYSSKGCFPEGLEGMLAEEVERLRGSSFAVRSSSTLEDLPGASFAGQYSSYLNVSKPELEEAVVRCWESFWNERAVEYRERFKLTHGVSQCVIIQEMVDADVSGVVFTANPMNGNRNQMVVNASYGLGEAIVGGRVDPDQYVLDKATGEVMGQEISVKKTACVYGEKGTAYVPVEEGRKTEPALSGGQLGLLLELGKRIENAFESPQDMEFAIDRKGRLHIVQSRDITTLYPVEALEQDGKLRAYLSAGTVLLGMKEPFTPLGYDMMSQMFPTILNVMTMKKKPLDDRFVKYAGCRIYVDMTYLLSNGFVSRQFANAFSGNDLPLKDVMNGVIRKYGKVFRHQGVRFRIPLGVFKYGMAMGAAVRRIKKVPMEQRYASMVRDGNEVYDRLSGQRKTLASLEEKVRFSRQCLVDAFLLSQKQAVYCTEMTGFAGIKKRVDKMYKDRFDLGLLGQSLPGCVTQELTIRLNEAARHFDSQHMEPHAQSPKVQEILRRFGHRGNTEMDFGTKRWAEDPEFLLDQIRSYRTDQAYDRNLRDIEGKRQRAEELIEEIHQAVEKDHGLRKAEKLKRRMLDYRSVAGMREYPKYDIVRMLGLARKVMLDLGEELVAAGKLEQAEDVFYLRREDLLGVDALAPTGMGPVKKKMAENRRLHQREMARVRIPRLLVNNGEAYYSAHRIDPDSKVLQGMPLSPGICEGKVRIVMDPKSEVLEKGEILVTESTNPSWTPLFATAGGLIMEYGGPVSHGGIVAREYGIPAVVGIPSASGLLKNGQHVRVNGETGVVEILG
ncbi:PEP/pyruvate-binding domain-containing protein [Anaerotalea alkaliphila]|uniref:Phosphoenolpyruvate synthase n=1 Tax=Anaerotalea alkaliphila TaxID=2662126 RepID=A0A7X5HWD8_9FIRM|nr:PEP/pyruvate-binding domain-containing protein [Anaerotalea alkaliphila]NDL67858.1 hypothetical protein [Anaerotalea alkaliphila]